MQDFNDLVKRQQRRKRRRDIQLYIKYRKLGVSKTKTKFVRNEDYIKRIYAKYRLKYRTLEEINNISDDKLKAHAMKIRTLVEQGKYKAYKREIFYQNVNTMLDNIESRSGLHDEIKWIKEQLPRLTIRTLNRLVYNINTDVETYSAEAQQEMDEATIENITSHIKGYIEQFGYRKG